MKTKHILGAIIIAAVALGWLGHQAAIRIPSPAADEEKISVVASLYPLADFTENIGGDLIRVIITTPAGAEPHDYEPTPQDIAAAYHARLFIYNGNGLDAWAEKIAPDLAARGVTVIKMADHLDSLKADAPESARESYDPHFWLDPINAAKEAGIITEALVKLDPAHENMYRQNNGRFADQLMQLDQEYMAGLAGCRIREIITSHNAFNYLAKRYNLTTLYILGLSPDEEPSPKTMARVADIAKEKHIKYIFFETLVNSKLSETIAHEIGARTLTLNPIEGLTDEEVKSGKNYISIMRDNLANLKIALSCP